MGKPYLGFMCSVLKLILGFILVNFSAICLGNLVKNLRSFFFFFSPNGRLYVNFRFSFLVCQ
jgi:hypothetical protein